MSFYDGKIPACCRACFEFRSGQWFLTDQGLCDECGYMLEMFPIISSDRKINHDALWMLNSPEEPIWRI